MQVKVHQRGGFVDLLQPLFAQLPAQVAIMTFILFTSFALP